MLAVQHFVTLGQTQNNMSSLAYNLRTPCRRKLSPRYLDYSMTASARKKQRPCPEAAPTTEPTPEPTPERETTPAQLHEPARENLVDPPTRPGPSALVVRYMSNMRYVNSLEDTWPDIKNAQVFSIENLRYCSWFDQVLRTQELEEFKNTMEVKVKKLRDILLKYKNRGSVWVQYGEYCNIYCEGDMTVTEDRVASYQKYRIQKRDETNIGLGKTVQEREESEYEAVKSGNTSLNSVKDWQKVLEGKSLAKLDSVSVLLSEARIKLNEAQANPDDPGNTLRAVNRRLTDSQQETLTETWWSGKACDGRKSAFGRINLQMRGILFNNINRGPGFRGQNIRPLKLSSFVTRRVKTVGPAPFRVLRAATYHVKQEKVNRAHPIDWVRDKERLDCGLGSISTHVVWLNDLSPHEKYIDMMKKDLTKIENWADTGAVGVPERPRHWNYHLIFAADPSVPISSSQHIKDIREGLTAAEIAGLKAVSHKDRGGMAGNLTENNSNLEEIRAHGGWDKSVEHQYIEGGVKVGTVLPAFNWGPPGDLKGYEAYWEGEDSDIPDTLKQKVLPGLDSVYEIAKRVLRKTGRYNGSVENCEALMYMRKVFLEDSLMKRHLFPDFPAYKHPVFDMEEYHRYKIAEEKRIKARMGGQMYIPSPTILPPVHVPRIYKPFTVFEKVRNMKDTYEEWDSEIRLEFTALTENGQQIQWKRTFGDTSGSIKSAFDHIVPFCKLVDKYIDVGKTKEQVLDALLSIQEKYDVKPWTFVKAVLNGLHLDNTTTSFSKHIPISRVEFREELEALLSSL